MAVLATGFLFNKAGGQHSAILQRHMRFTALVTIDMIFLAVEYHGWHWQGHRW
jgi:hypothetical protein